MTKRFEDFLTRLAEALDYSSLAPDANGACLIHWKKGDLHLLFEFDETLVPNTILLSSSLTSLPVENQGSCLEALLRENSKREETLSIKPDAAIVSLHRRLHPEIPASSLKEVVTAFIAHAQEWKVRVHKPIVLTQPQFDF